MLSSCPSPPPCCGSPQRIPRGPYCGLMTRAFSKWSKNFNIELLEVIFGCCVTNTYDDDTMSPDVGIKSNLIINRNVVLSRLLCENGGKV